MKGLSCGLPAMPNDEDDDNYDDNDNDFMFMASQRLFVLECWNNNYININKDIGKACWCMFKKSQGGEGCCLC